METTFGLGMMLGPFFGGLLYEVGGFYFPFAICGGSLIICAIIQIAKRFDSLNARVPPTNDHFKRHSVTYECPLNYK